MNFKVIKYVFFSVLFICLLTLVMDKHTQFIKNYLRLLVLDQESLFSNTEWGKSILKNVEDKVYKLAA